MILIIIALLILFLAAWSTYERNPAIYGAQLPIFWWCFHAVFGAGVALGLLYTLWALVAMLETKGW